MAIAVHHHHVTWRHGVVPHNFVGSAGAIGHKKAVVGIENTRRIALALADSPIVIQQLTQFFNGIADVGTQHVFTKKLVKHLTDWTFQEGHTARVSWAMP